MNLEAHFMPSGRELIDEIEQALSDLDIDDWELSGNLEEFILEKCELFLSEWREVKRKFSEKSGREQLNLMLDLTQSEAYSEREKLQTRVDILDKIDLELEALVVFDDEEQCFEVKE
jgi:hypothetical protein